MQKRVRVIDGVSGRGLLDVSVEELQWPDDSDRILSVSDALLLMDMDEVYSDLLRVQPVGGNVMQGFEQLEWGSEYQLLRRRCPRCTVCGSCCVRGPGQHLLCAHDMSETCVHLWHDLRVRKHSIDSGFRRHIIVQGYCDGCGLETEFSADEVSTGIQDVIFEELGRAETALDFENRFRRITAWHERFHIPAVRHAAWLFLNIEDFDRYSMDNDDVEEVD